MEKGRTKQNSQIKLKRKQTKIWENGFQQHLTTENPSGIVLAINACCVKRRKDKNFVVTPKL